MAVITKKICLAVAALFLLSSAAFAGPLMDYSQGEGAIDITLRPSNNIDIGGSSIDGNNSNFDFGLTFGLGNNWAFQWQNQTTKSKTYSGTLTDGINIASGSLHTKLTANQFNILYKLDKNCSAFAGYTQAKNEVPITGTINGIPINGTIGGKSVNGYQLGFTGSFPLGEKLTGYGTVGFGNKIQNFEFGIAYEFSQNTELNVSYKNIKYKELQFDIAGAEKYDLKADGLAVGLTYKF